MNGKLSTVKNYAKLHRKIAILLTAVVVVMIGVLIAIFVIWKNKSGGQETSYREYQVQEGDVTVGTTESGTASLDLESISFPVSCEIQEVLVKSGQTVKKGDALVKLDLTSVADGSSDIRQKLDEAKISLQQALNDQKSKLETARITYESSKYLSQSAPVTREMTVAELQNAVETARQTLEKDQKSLSEYQALQKTWQEDYNKLQELEEWRDEAEQAKESYTTQLSTFNEDNETVLDRYNSLKTAMNTAKTKWYQSDYGIEDDDNTSDYEEAYDNAKDAFNDYYDDTAKAVLDQQDELQDKVDQSTASYNNYVTAYDNFKEDYDDKYDVTGTDLDDKVTSLQNSVKTDSYNLEKAQKTASISSVDAKTKEETDLVTAKYAQDTYDLTVSQLQQEAEAQQETYDQLQRQMDEINNAINGDGVITSPCDGLVAAVTYTAGDSPQADDAIMVVAEDNSVSLSVSVSEDDIGNVSIGQEASISLSSYENETFDATVESITAEPARSNSSSVSYTVVVKMTGDDVSATKVFEGMSGEATIIQRQAKNVLYVSNRAVTFQDGVSSVLVKSSDGSQTRKTVKTGFSDGTYVEITSGLEEGETVLAESAVTSK